MPIYEFKCVKCEAYLELLVMNQDEEVDLKCANCNSEDLERIISSANYAMGAGSGESTGVNTQDRTCSSGNCTTYEIPGHAR